MRLGRRQDAVGGHHEGDGEGDQSRRERTSEREASPLSPSGPTTIRHHDMAEPRRDGGYGDDFAAVENAEPLAQHDIGGCAGVQYCRHRECRQTCCRTCQNVRAVPSNCMHVESLPAITAELIIFVDAISVSDVGEVCIMEGVGWFLFSTMYKEDHDQKSQL